MVETKKNMQSVFLQELHCINECIDQWKQEWDNEIFLSGNSSNSTGIGILLNLNTSYDIIEYKDVIPGRLQLLKISTSNTTTVVINIYGPNIEDIAFFTTLEHLVIENK